MNNRSENLSCDIKNIKNWFSYKRKVLIKLKKTYGKEFLKEYLEKKEELLFNVKTENINQSVPLIKQEQDDQKTNNNNNNYSFCQNPINLMLFQNWMIYRQYLNYVSNFNEFLMIRSQPNQNYW